MLLCKFKDGTELTYQEAAAQKRLGEVREVIFTNLTKDSYNEELEPLNSYNSGYLSSLKKITIKDSYISTYHFSAIRLPLSLEEVEVENATIAPSFFSSLIENNPQLKQIKKTNTRYDQYGLEHERTKIDEIEQSIRRINEFSGETDLPDYSPPGSEYGDEEGSQFDYDEDEDYQESDIGGDDEEEVSSQGTDNSEEVHVKISTARPAKANPKRETQSVASSTATVNRMRAAVNKVLPTRSRTTSGASDLASEDGDAEFTVTKDYALRSQNVEGSMLGDEVDLYSNPDQMPDIDSARQRYTPPSTIQIRCRLADDSEDDVMTDYSALTEDRYADIVEMHIIGNGSLNTNILTEIDFSTLPNLAVLSVADASIASDSDLDLSEIVLDKLREVHIGSGCAVNARGIEVFTMTSVLESIDFAPGTKRAESKYGGYIQSCDNFEATGDGLAELEVINELIGEAGKLSGGYSDDLFEDFYPEPAKKSSTTTPIKQSISCRLQGDHPGQDVRDYTELSPAQRKKITTLTITGAGVAPEDLYPNVINAVNWSELSQLQHLDLVDVSLQGSFPLLAIPDAQLFPNLQTVEFTRCGLDIDTLERLARASGSRLFPFTIEDCFDVNEEGTETELNSEALNRIQERIILFHTVRFREEEPTEMARNRTFSAGSSEFDLDILQGEELQAPEGVTISCRMRDSDEDILFDYGLLTADRLSDVVEIRIQGTGTATNILKLGINWRDFPNVTKLTLSNTSLAKFDSDIFYDRDPSALPNLRELDFGGNTAVNEEGIRAFLTIAPELSTIKWGYADWAADKGRDGRIIVRDFSDSQQGKAEGEKLTALGLELQGHTGAVRKPSQPRVVNGRRKSVSIDEDAELYDLFGEADLNSGRVVPSKSTTSTRSDHFSLRKSANEGYIPSQGKPTKNLGSRQVALPDIRCKTKSDTVDSPFRSYDEIPEKEDIDYIYIIGDASSMLPNYDLMKDSRIDWSRLDSLMYLKLAHATVEGSLPENALLPSLINITFEDCVVDEEALDSFYESSRHGLLRVAYDGSDNEVIAKAALINNANKKVDNDNDRPTIYYSLKDSDWIEYLGTETEALKSGITHLWIKGSDRTHELNRDINLKDFKNLEQLTIAGVTITDDVFEDEEDEELFPNLRALSVSNCNVDYGTLLSFSEASTDLTYIKMEGLLNRKGKSFTMDQSRKIQALERAIPFSTIAGKKRGTEALMRNMVQQKQERATAPGMKVEQEEPLSGQKYRQSLSSTNGHAFFGKSMSRRPLSSTASNTAKRTTQFRGARVESTYHAEREELRTVDKIRECFVAGLQEIDAKRQSLSLEPLHRKYTVTTERQDNCVRLNYKPDSSSVEPIKVLEVDASTDTTTVYKNWSTQVDPGNKHISLEEKALIVLHSLGIPPCPPDIKISNETSKLAQEVRKQFAILQEAQYLAEEEGDEAAMTVSKVGKGYS